MGLLKKILNRCWDLKLIISSATVDAEVIRDFLNRVKEKNQKTSPYNMLKNYIDTDLISDPRDLEVEVSSVEQVTD